LGLAGRDRILNAARHPFIISGRSLANPWSARMRDRSTSPRLVITGAQSQVRWAGGLVRMAGLEFRVLGRVEVLRGGKEVAVGRSGTLNLLAGLLVSANTVVAGDALVEVAWGEAQPAHPRAALHNKISRLRQLLGDETIQTVGDA